MVYTLKSPLNFILFFLLELMTKLHGFRKVMKVAMIHHGPERGKEAAALLRRRTQQMMSEIRTSFLPKNSSSFKTN